MNIPFRIAVALLATGSACAAQSQVSPQAAAEPSQRSVWGQYRPFTPGEPRADWRAANEAVRAAGGHMGMMKGMEHAKPAAKAPAALQDHSGHGAPGTKR